MNKEMDVTNYTHDTMSITFKENILKIITSDITLDYDIDNLDILQVEKVLSLLSQITLECIFKVELVEDYNIFINSPDYNLNTVININESESFQDKLSLWNTIINELNAIKVSNPEINIFFEDDDILYLEHPDWETSINFTLENHDEFLEDIQSFFKNKYIDNHCFYNHNYMEYCINFPNLDMIIGLVDLPEIFSSQSEIPEINFEITKITKPFFNLMMKDTDYGNDVDYESYDYHTLKIFNLNTNLDLNYQDADFLQKSTGIAKNFVFQLSMKYDIQIKIAESNEIDTDYNDLIFSLSEKIEMVKENDLVFKKEYDSDLIDYYYRASLMEDSQFKYIAYYQVIECIYDEVLMANTVQDIQQLISSNWFNVDDKNNVQLIVDKLKLHNNSKKDEDKLKLVLEKYFRNNASDEVFLEVNRELINLLIKMKKINKREEFKDLQKLQQIIYRFRCDCTHSNRSYPISKVDDSNSIQEYIKLIRLVSERIILNY